MKTETVPIDSLHEDERNARLHPKKNLKAIRGSLQRFEQVEPLVVQASTGKVIGGNGRLAVMRELGWKKVEVVKVDLSDKDATALGLALNRTAETAEWDDDQLAELLREVGDAAFEVGWDEKELVSFLEGIDAATSVPPPVPSVDLVQRGKDGSRMVRDGSRDVVGVGRFIGAVDIDICRQTIDVLDRRWGEDHDAGCAWVCSLILANRDG